MNVSFQNTDLRVFVYPVFYFISNIAFSFILKLFGEFHLHIRS